MPRYSVQFISVDLLTVEVSADDQKEAEEKAEKKINKGYIDPDVSIDDGKLEHCGYWDNDLLEKLHD